MTGRPDVPPLGKVRTRCSLMIGGFRFVITEAGSRRIPGRMLRELTREIDRWLSWDSRAKAGGGDSFILVYPENGGPMRKMEILGLYRDDGRGRLVGYPGFIVKNPDYDYWRERRPA